MAGSFLGLRPTLLVRFLLLSSISKSITNYYKLRLRSGFQPPARASGFEVRNLFRASQNITCSVRVNRKSALRIGLGKAEKTAWSRSAHSFYTPMIFFHPPFAFKPLQSKVAFSEPLPY